MLTWSYLGYDWSHCSSKPGQNSVCIISLGAILSCHLCHSSLSQGLLLPPMGLLATSLHFPLCYFSPLSWVEHTVGGTTQYKLWKRIKPTITGVQQRIISVSVVARPPNPAPWPTLQNKCRPTKLGLTRSETGFVTLS